jgi:hypothetical protein
MTPPCFAAATRPAAARALLAAALACAIGSCDAGPIQPTAGELELAVISPNGSEGAALIELEGVAFARITAVNGRVFTHRSGDRTRVVILRDFPGNLVIRVAVDDVQDRPRVMILEVASGDNGLRDELSEYRVETTELPAP